MRHVERNMRILHVDDAADFLDLAAEFLHRENSGMEVTTITDAESALDVLHRGRIDCVVSDYDMPAINGLQFLRRVREQDGDLPFILFTGKGSEEIASRAISAGVTDYLQKGGGTDQYALLANRIENAVREYRALQQVNRGFQAMETAREGISLLNNDGRFVYLNEAYAALVGYERDELLGEHWEILYPAENVGMVSEEILPQVPVAGRWSDVTTYVRKDGTRIEVDHALAYTDGGTMICLIQAQ